MTIGLRDLFKAPVTEGADGKDVFGTPSRLAKAIEVDMSVESAEAILHADDGVDEIFKEFVGGEIKININDLTPEACAELLGQRQDANGVVIAGEDDDPPYVAIGFRARKSGGRYAYVWLYKVKFEIPDEKYETKKDKIEIKTPEIVGKFMKNSDGEWKASHVALPTDTIATAWFTKVYRKQVAA